MQILTEQEVVADIGLLNRAWDGNELFVLLPEKVEVPRRWIEAGVASLPAQQHPGTFALLTSGSAGQPKLVFGRRERSEHLARVLHELQRSEPVRETVVALPLSYCYAFVNQWLWAKVHGRTLTLTLGFKRPDELLARLANARDAMFCGVGAQMSLFSYHFAGRSFPGIIRLHFAGGQFPARDIEAIERSFPNAVIFNNYGCAEAMPRLTLRPWSESHEGANIGRPLPGVELRTDEQDRILFRSAYGAIAFYDERGLTSIGPGDWVSSGDLGEPIEGGYWRITGRSNEVFKRFGEKIALPRLLTTVYTVWGQQAAFYRAKDRAGEDGHALVLAPRPTDEQLHSVLQAFRKNHPRTHWPIRIETTEALPLLDNGKTDVQRLATLPDKTLLWDQKL
jgi:acyl-CoA synthetase (AMP-forming)/AMP-acid ligase II